MPFPSTFPTLLNPDPALNAALVAALAETQVRFSSANVLSRLAISVAAVDETADPLSIRHAGIQERVTHYSASLLKVAALYAAFQLRQSANNFSVSVAEPTPAELFAHMRATFDPAIESAVPLISSDPVIQSSMKVPKYQSIFVAIPLVDGGFSVVFSASFLNSIRDMIVNSSNSAAATCIEQLGYSWINGVLSSGGFFNPLTKQGMWLVGTFTGSLPYVRIPSANDGLVAQATTCFDMANLYALLFQKTAIDDQGHDKICDEMLQLLADTASGPDPSWLKARAREGIAGLSNDIVITHTKIGLGPLKRENGGFDVASEGAIARHIPSGQTFMTVWQNSRNDIVSLNAITFLIDRTIKHSLGIP